ncbi:putative maltose high-affinity maltose transporter (alpha-glucoside transporter) protein [Phaeoacremonium minimum UCRPA7]|uniref:Putative maltose high-affinity maltose transporter (Alpha-glucoside transporter) protein n=1 Tax=Phaeoacremonium minimum (strain UCR-PA7) TaxID=1286976 RepID=R8B9B5_PHAM7|nr:putative maltose high-affinity maltose transporter (alpha-glucoside transporter) protein [Phaeoacremonium minimum UCRPA7]EON95900.1 putative maltose high-affinity maltose transporter (alpha-glucoside transporter) protein [Phaeoacremonium minimum UCRPA7]
MESLRKDPWLLFWIGVMLWTLGVRGFEAQASGSVISIPYFKKTFGKPLDGDYYIETSWQSALNGGGNATGIVGALLASYFIDIIGYKPVILFACVINLASVGVEFGSTSIAMFFGGKMMNFVAIGAFQNACTTYVADIAPLAIRASAIGFCNLAQCIGPFLSAIMSYYTAQWDTEWSWKALICAQWGFAGIAFIGQIFMPESPVYLVRRGKMTAARKVLGRLYKDPSDADGHLEVIKLTLEESETSKSTGSYIDCFRGTNLRRTLIAMLAFLAEPMSGLGFVGSYGALMYQYVGIGARQSFLLQIGAQILSMSGATIAFLVSDFYGRRPMFLVGCTALAVLLICMGIAGSINTVAATTAAVGFYTMYNFFYNVGVGSGVYAIAGEMPTSSLRGKSLALSMMLSNATNTMWAFVCPYIFNPGYGNLKAKIGFIFGAFMLIWAVMGFYHIPETRRRTYEELDELFMNHVPARQFRKYVTVAEQRAAEAYSTEHKAAAAEAEHV